MAKKQKPLSIEEVKNAIDGFSTAAQMGLKEFIFNILEEKQKAAQEEIQLIKGKKP